MSGEALAVITARGGSRRIPRKNIKPFLGRPILEYPIAAALESGCFREVMVSTDDEEIARVAERNGARVPFMRSAKTADDHATTAAVLLEVLSRYREAGKDFEFACCIYPTAPFASAEKLRRGHALLQERGASSVIPVVRFGYPIQRALSIDDGRLRMIVPANIDKRSQDLPPAYHDAGQFYWFRVRDFVEDQQLFGRHAVPLVVSETEVQDIDTEEDWRLAEMKFQLMRERAGARG